MAKRVGKAKSRSRLRKWLRRGVFILVGLALFMVFALLGARLYLSNNRVRTIAERGMRRALGRPVRIGEVKWRLFESFRMDELVVEEKGEYGGGDLASLGSVEVRYDWSSLFRKRLDIEEIRAVQPVIRLVRSREGKVNIVDLPARGMPVPEPGKEGVEPSFREWAEIPVVVNKITLENAMISYADNEEDISVRLDGIDAEWRVSGVVPHQGSASGTVSVASLEYRGGGFSWKLPEILVQLSLAFDTRIGSASLEAVRFKMPGMAAQGTGFIEGVNGDRGKMGLSLDFEGDLSELPAGPVGLKEIGKSGTWHASIAFQGPVDRPAGGIDFAAADIRISIGDREWLSLDSLEARERLAEGTGNQVDADGRIVIANLTADGLKPVSRIEISHLVQLDPRSRSVSLPSASAVFPGGEVFAAGSLVKSTTGGLIVDCRLSGSGKLDKLVRWLMAEEMDGAILGDIGYRLRILGPVGSPVLAAEVESDLIQYVPKENAESRVFLRDLFSRVGIEPQEDLGGKCNVAARYRPVLTRAGEESVDFGTVEVEGQGEFLPDVPLIRFGQMDVRAPGFSISGEMEIRLPAGGQSLTESVVVIHPPLMKSMLLGVASEEAAIGL
jgi:hypothetical protein